MNKSIAKMLVLLLVVSLFITGCSSDKNTTTASGNSAGTSTDKSASKSSDNSKVNSEAMQISVIGASPTGLWAAIAEGLGQAIKKEYPGSNFTYLAGQLGPNIVSVATKKANYGMDFLPSLVLGRDGKNPYKEKYTNLRAIGSLFVNPYHFMVTSESKITSIEDIKDKKIPITVSVHTANSAADILTRLVFENYGMTYKDIESWGGKIVFLAQSNTIDMVKDGRMQAQVGPMPAPASIYTELSISKDINLLPLNDKAIKSVYDSFGVSEYTIKKDTYKFLDSDVRSLGVNTVLFTRDDVSEEEVYKITKAFYNNLELLKKLNATYKSLGSGSKIILDVGIPLHPGAEKFYKEVGVLK